MKKLTPVKVIVTYRKYTEWKRHPHFSVMGGLLGLGLGVDKKRNITTKVSVNIYLNTYICNHLARELEKRGFTEKLSCRAKGYYEYILTEIVDFPDKEKADEKASEYCKAMKEEILSFLRDKIAEYMELNSDITDGSIWDLNYVSRDGFLDE